MYDIIVIGGGASGMTAALYALRASKSVLILEKENFGGQIATSPRVENFPSIKTMSGLEFSDNLFAQIDALGVAFELDTALKIQKQGDIFVVEGEYNTYEARSVIIANGVKHRKINVEGEDELIGHGVSYCATCDGAFFKDQETFVIGDANSALQYALLLANYSPKVNLITLFGKFFADDILIRRIKENDKIVVHDNWNLVELKQNNGELQGLVFENRLNKELKKEFKASNVFIAIGQIPDNERFSNLVELEKGYILTDEDMATKTEGVFACGDTKKKGMRQLVTACNDGAIAAMSAIRYIDTLDI